MNKYNLPNWKKFSLALKAGNKAKDFGFYSKDGDITRVNARYRVAKSFHKIELEGFSIETTSGYEGLLKVFLTFSTLEGYINLITNNENPSIPLVAFDFINREKANLVSKKVLKLDNKKKFYTFIKRYVTRDNIKNEIDKFYNNEEHNLVFLLSGIRHIFGHGYLSASSNGISPKKVNKICMLLSDFILNEIANDFALRIEDAS